MMNSEWAEVQARELINSKYPQTFDDKGDEINKDRTGLWYGCMECSGDEIREDLINLIAIALVQAEDNGFARGQEKKASCICTATKVGDAYCELHRPMFERAKAQAEARGRNRGLEEGAKVAENCDCLDRTECPCDGTAEAIRTLKSKEEIKDAK